MPSLKSLYMYMLSSNFHMWKVLHVFSRFQWNAGLRGHIHFGISNSLHILISVHIFENFLLKLKVDPTKIFGDISVFVRFFYLSVIG